MDIPVFIYLQDEEGYYSITGRIKELIILADGENVPPVLIEEAIKKELPCISNAMVVGDRKKFLSCILTFKVDVDQVCRILWAIFKPHPFLGFPNLPSRVAGKIA